MMQKIVMWIAIAAALLALLAIYRITRGDPDAAPGIIFERRDRPSYS